MELQIQVHISQKFELQWLVQKLFHQDLMQRLWIVGLLGKVFVLCIMEWSGQNRRPRQVEFCGSYQLIPCAGTMRVRKVLVNRNVSDSDSKSWMFSFKLFPDTSLGEDTKSCTPCDFTLVVTTPLVTDSFFLVPFLPLSSRIVHTNSKLLRQYWADLQNEWFETRARCLKHPHWSVWCLCYFSFSGFHDSKHWYSWMLDDRYLWTVPLLEWLWSPVFLQVCNCTLHTTSFHLQDRGRSSVPARISSRIPWHFLNRNTNSFVSFSCPLDVVEHWQEDDLHPGSLEESVMTKTLGKYSTNSIGSPSILSNSL